MRKSSLGKRGRSTVPVRIPSLSGAPEPSDGATNKGNCVRSFIPRPSRSRSSSIDRNVQAVNWPGTALSTPLATPMSGGLCASIIRNQRLRETTSKTPKDVRPLTDKNFQVLAIQNIHNYFKENTTLDITKIPKTLSGCSFTLKTFVDMCNHLFSYFFKNDVVDMANYTEKVPQLAKLMGYPNIVKKSWLVTANSPHTLHHVLGLLSWLVDAVVAVSGCMSLPEENDADCVTSERLLQYYLECYEKFSNGHDHELENQQLKQEAMTKMKVTDNDFKELQDTASKLEQALEMPEVVQNVAENRELNETKAKLLNEYSMTEKSLQQKMDCYDKLKQNIEELQNSIATIESAKGRDAESILKLSECLKNQACTPEDIIKKEKRCRELEEAIKLDENALEMWSKDNYALDLEMANIRAKLNVALKDYTSLIVKNIDMFPELEDMKVYVNLLNHDAAIHLQEIASSRDSYIKKLKTEVQGKETILEEIKEACQVLEHKGQQLSDKYSQENSKVEDLKRELSVLDDNFRRQKQDAMETLEKLQNELAALECGSSDCDPLANRLQDLIGTDRIMDEKTESLHKEAEKCFKETGEMFGEYAQKMAEVVKPLIELYISDSC